MKKRIQIDLPAAAFNQIATMCESLGTTPAAFFEREMQAAALKLRQLYAEHQARVQPPTATVEVVDVEVSE